MTYDNLFSEFCEIFKNDEEIISGIQTDLSINDDDGMHVLFGMVITPFVINLIETENLIEIEKAFDFFEKMDLSGNSNICEVLEFSVLENLISSPVFPKCKKYMLPETRKSCEAIEQWTKL